MKQSRSLTELWIQDEELKAIRLRRLRKEIATLVGTLKSNQYSHDDILTALRQSIDTLIQEKAAPTEEWKTSRHLIESSAETNRG